MTSRTANGKRKGLVLALSLLIPALLWLVASGQFALRSGGNSDIYRQWVTSQYIMRGIDPYRVAFETLRLNYGETRGPARLRLSELKIYEVHPNLRTDGIEGIIPEYGPPTATYPPSSLLMLVVTVGQLPQRLLLPIWLTVNLAALVFLIISLGKNSRSDATPNGLMAFLPVGVLTLLWPPTQELLRTSQFGFWVLIWLIAAVKYMPTDSIRSALFFSLSLLKPSLALPFLILPLIRKRWLILGVVAAVHGVGTLIMSALIHTSPWTLISEWMEIPRYMLQGAYTLQEVLNRIGIENTPAGMMLVFGLLGAALLWSIICRRANDGQIVSFLCFISIVWTYHERYDFVILLIPMIALFNTQRPFGARAAMWILFILLAAALTDPVYLSACEPTQIIRWLGRLALAVLFLWTSLDMTRREGNGIVSA